MEVATSVLVYTVTVTCPRTFITLLSSARHFLNLPGRTMDTLRVLCSSGSQCPFVEDPMCQERPQCRVKSALTEALQGYFQHDSFRPGQLAASLSSTHGQDVFVRMATGSGKSLCMFLGPLAVSNSAMGIIISPLIGLMDQQVRMTSVCNGSLVFSHSSG